MTYIPIFCPQLLFFRPDVAVYSIDHNPTTTKTAPYTKPKHPYTKIKKPLHHQINILTPGKRHLCILIDKTWPPVLTSRLLKHLPSSVYTTSRGQDSDHEGNDCEIYVIIVKLQSIVRFRL